MIGKVAIAFNQFETPLGYHIFMYAQYKLLYNGISTMVKK